MRLDRIIGAWARTRKRRTRKLIARGAVRVDGEIEKRADVLLSDFAVVYCGAECVRRRLARYVMLAKPAGVVCATKDAEHGTVVDLIDESWAGDLHLAGRLDRFTTGLVILTNDGRFSEALTWPGNKIGKRYFVEVDGGIGPEVMAAFGEGIFFAKEKITTAPAQVEMLSERACRLTIYEGKHHQVKRMFACFGLKVTRLHRESVGAITLDADLAPGGWRFLTEAEIRAAAQRAKEA